MKKSKQLLDFWNNKPKKAIRAIHVTTQMPPTDLVFRQRFEFQNINVAYVDTLEMTITSEIALFNDKRNLSQTIVFRKVEGIFNTVVTAGPEGDVETVFVFAGDKITPQMCGLSKQFSLKVVVVDLEK